MNATEHLPCVFVIDDDAALCEVLSALLEDHGMRVQTFLSGVDFLSGCSPDLRGCVLLDMNLPEMSGLEVQRELDDREIDLPVIFLTGHGDLDSSSQAFRCGAVDYLEKPVHADRLLERVTEALTKDAEKWHHRRRRAHLSERFARLTAREQEVLKLVVSGYSTKQIAQALAISNRTVDVYRAHIMEKTHSKSVADLVGMCVELDMDNSN